MSPEEIERYRKEQGDHGETARRTRRPTPARRPRAASRSRSRTSSCRFRPTPARNRSRRSRRAPTRSTRSSRTAPTSPRSPSGSPRTASRQGGRQARHVQEGRDARRARGSRRRPRSRRVQQADARRTTASTSCSWTSASARHAAAAATEGSAAISDSAREEIKEKLYAQALEDRYTRWLKEDLRQRHYGGDAAREDAAAGRRLDGRPDRHRPRSHPRRPARRAACAARCTPILVGDLGVYRDAAARCGARRCASPPGSRRRRCRAARSPCARSRPCRPRQRRPGHPDRWPADAPRTPPSSKRCGWCAPAPPTRWCTAPISKANLVAAGLHASGHTELLAELCGDVPVRMMMVGDTPARRPGHHPPRPRATSRDAFDAAARARDASRIADRALREQFGIRPPAPRRRRPQPARRRAGRLRRRGACASSRPAVRARAPPRHRRQRPARRRQPVPARAGPGSSTPSSACTTTRAWRRSSCCTSPTA